jgi:5-formyltetrahydrofolate cyclo-ligase
MLSLSKEEIRRVALERRLSIGAADRARFGDAVARRVIALPEIRQARCVHIFSAMPERGEIDTGPIISQLRRAGKRIVLPVVRTFEPGSNGLLHHEWDGSTALTRNRWGVGEPLDGPAVPVGDIDAVIVPLLAVDMHGNRIGYGKGFYDAFLREVDAPAIGLVWDACLFPALPAEAHDVALGIIVTESRVIRTHAS